MDPNTYGYHPLPLTRVEGDFVRTFSAGIFIMTFNAGRIGWEGVDKGFHITSIKEQTKYKNY